MTVREVLEKGKITRFYPKQGGSPIYDLEAFMDCDCSIEMLEDDDGYCETGPIIRREYVGSVDTNKMDRYLFIKNLQNHIHTRDGAYRVQVNYLNTLIDLFLGKGE